MKNIKELVLRTCLLLIATTLVAACGNNSDNNAITQDEITVRSLPWVEVRNHRLVDELGRELSLRGVNARIEGLFDVTFDDGRVALEPIPAFSMDDAQAMVRYGFNVLRLPINWSGLEPHEGEFSETYFDKLDEVVNLARDAGLYVLLDFHQDAWSKEIGEDGAPLWAIVPPPEKLLEGPLDDLPERRVSEQVLNAFEGFFENREGIQDRFLPVWKRVIERYADRPEVIGFQPMNEPLVSHFDLSQGLLHDFYKKLVPPMRELDARHALWMEPGVIRNYLNSAPLLDEPFPDSNIVYCPHIYPSGVTASTYEQWKAWLVENYSNMQEEANSWGGALDSETYAASVLPHVARLVSGAKALGVPVILYVNGCSHLLEVLARAKPDVLGIDWRISLTEARERVGGGVALQGNLDPCVLFAPPAVVEREVNRVLDEAAGMPGHVFNLGSGILPKTPVESMEVLFRTVRARREG